MSHNTNYSNLNRAVASFMGRVATSPYSSEGKTVSAKEMKAVTSILEFDGKIDKTDRQFLENKFLGNKNVKLSDGALDQLLDALGLGGGPGPFPIQPMYGVLVGELVTSAKASGDKARLGKVITAVEGALAKTPTAEFATMTAFSPATTAASSKRSEVAAALADAKAVYASMG